MSLCSQNILKKAEICRKYVKYLKYVIFLKNDKICKNIFFTYLHILFESRYDPWCRKRSDEKM